MLTQGRFLISYQVFDNIPVNNNGQTHVQLNGLLENTQIVFTFIDGDMKPAFYFEIPRDTNRYLILGILDEAGYPHCCLLGQPKQMFNPQLN